MHPRHPKTVLCWFAGIVFIIIGASLAFVGLRQNELDQNLTEAIGKADSKAVRRLLAIGANPDSDMWHGYSWRDHLSRIFERQPRLAENMPVLHYAIDNIDLVDAKLLLEYGATPDKKDNTGRTPLLLAVSAGEPEIVLILLSKGVDVNVHDNRVFDNMTLKQIAHYRGPSVFHLARQNVDMAESLIASSHGKDRASVLRFMATDLATAQQRIGDYRSIVQMLRQAGAKD